MVGRYIPQVGLAPPGKWGHAWRTTKAAQEVAWTAAKVLAGAAPQSMPHQALVRSTVTRSLSEIGWNRAGTRLLGVRSKRI